MKIKNIIKNIFIIIICLLLFLSVTCFLVSFISNILTFLGYSIVDYIFPIMLFIPLLIIISFAMSFYYIGKDDGRKPYKYGIRDWPAVKYAPLWMINFFFGTYIYDVIIFIWSSIKPNDGSAVFTCILMIFFSVPIPVFTSFIIKNIKNK